MFQFSMFPTFSSKKSPILTTPSKFEKPKSNVSNSKSAHCVIAHVIILCVTIVASLENFDEK